MGVVCSNLSLGNLALFTVFGIPDKHASRGKHAGGELCYSF